MALAAVFGKLSASAILSGVRAEVKPVILLSD